MVTLAPWNDEMALTVCTDLDPFDQAELTCLMGPGVSDIDLFVAWRGLAPARIFDRVAVCEGPGLRSVPFALVSLRHSGTFGVATAELIARDHQLFRHQMGRLCVEIRNILDDTAAAANIRRIECRCWAAHPTAAGLLRALGFEREGLPLPGFGTDGTAELLQFSKLIGGK